MKKLLCVILCVLISCFAITACSGNNTDDAKNSGTSDGGTISQNDNTGDDPASDGGNASPVAPTSSDDKGNTSKDDKPTSSSTQKPENSSTQKPTNSTGDKPTTSTGDKPTSSTGDKPTSSSDPGTSSGGTTGGDYPQTTNEDIYLSPNGNDSNSGSKDKPLYSLSVAVSRISAGHTIYMMPGTYNYNARIDLAKSGSEGQPITIQAYEWGEVVLDFTNQPYGFNDGKYVGLKLTGNYWKIQGITICHAGDNGIKVEGSHNYIGRVITHHNGDTGIQLGFGHSTNNPNGEMCAYNTIENCDSYLNYDFDNHGDADGFACKMHNGKGNVFIGCRAWRNCDDGWDLYETDWAVEIINCWQWESGNKADFANDKYFSDPNYLAKKTLNGKKISKPTSAGNGNGIKLGGNGSGGSSKGIHVVRNCVSFGNDITGSVKGFDENSHQGGVVVENCVAWDNGYNYMFEQNSGNKTFKNNISFYTGKGTQKPNRAPGEIYGSGVFENNNFTVDGGDLKMSLTVTADDFESISEADALAPRQADGSLPNNGFAKLKTSSQAYQKGMGVKR